MKKNTSLRILLGITQEEMALLLQVTRSQFSLYELGKRDLPAGAKLKIAELLKQAQNATTVAKESISTVEAQEKHQKKIVEDLLFSNQRKQRLLDSAISALEKKQQASKAALGLAHYLKNAASKTVQYEAQLANIIEQKATTEIKKNTWQAQMELQLKKELLLAEEKYLESISQNLK